MHMRGLFKVCGMLSCCLVSGAVAGEDGVRILQDHDLHVTETSGGEIRLRTLGRDPYMVIGGIGRIERDQAEVLEFEYFSPAGLENPQLFLGPTFRESVSARSPSLTVAEGWAGVAWDLRSLFGGGWQQWDGRTARIDWGSAAGVEIRIRNLRLRPRLPAERERAAEADARRVRKLQQAAQIRDYWAAEFEAEIESVAVTENHIVIRGSVPEATVQVELHEVRPHQSPAITETVMRHPISVDEATGRFQTQVDRMMPGYDRVASGWFLAAAGAGVARRVSATHHCDDFSAVGARSLDPIFWTESFKGLGGASSRIPLDDLLELGVRHTTINLPATGLLRDAPFPGCEPFEYCGRTWYADVSRLESTDQIVRFATHNEITVSAIILLVPSKQEHDDRLIHPDYDPAGVYAMPNLADESGALKYQAVLALLGQRYSRSDARYGRIDRWIMHNEVDYGWTWTNMGRQPREVYFDTLYRSLRLAHNVFRTTSPHAIVFISLTHHWNVADDSSWRTYAPRWMLETLAARSHAEGDFAWGIAYHPYPKSLWNAAAWNDAGLRDDVNTPLITIKNISVLDRFVETPRMRDSVGRVRPVVLSEQGYHTPDYSPASQQLQAAALVYTWDRLRLTRNILAFHYHRPIDHPDEGGLLLGLRTTPTADQPFGEKKQAWDVLRVLDTADEKQVADPLRAWIKANP